MRPPRFSLRNLRQRDIALAIVGLSLLAAVLWYLYMYRPTLQEAGDLQARVSTLSAQVTRGLAARNSLPQLREEIERLEELRIDFLAQLPRESEIASLLDELRANATAADVLLEVLTQQGGVTEDVQGVRPLGFNMTVSAPFAQTMDFLGRLEAMQRFTKIRQIGLGVPTNSDPADPELQSDYTFTVYVYTGADPGEN